MRLWNVRLLLNYDKNREYASVKNGTLMLSEDSIGLRAKAVISDAELIGKARNGELRGWSFGMYVNDSEFEERAGNIPRRHVRGLDIFEVSLIDGTNHEELNAAAMERLAIEVEEDKKNEK